MKMINLYVLFIIFFSSCTSPTSIHPDAKPAFDASVLGNAIGPFSDKIIIFSCTSCSCFREMFTKMNDADRSYLSSFKLVGDTSCWKNVNLTLFHTKQSTIDSMSIDIYNLTLLKKQGHDLKLRVIKTEESQELISICRSFFN